MKFPSSIRKLRTGLPLLRNERGQVLPMVAVFMIGFFGMCGIVMDVGRVYIGYRQLQSSVDASALAGAYTLPNTTASAAATNYSSVAGDRNAYSNLNGVTITTTLECLTLLKNQGIACAAPANANAIQVQETVSVPTYFAGIFGTRSVSLTATATAAMAGSAAVPYNVAIILDTTLSQASSDDNCGTGVTEMNCELQGVQVLLKSLTPCADTGSNCTVVNGVSANAVDSVALFVFPALSSTTYAIDKNCTTPITSAAARTYGYPSSSTYGYYSMQPETAWTGIASSTPYPFPTPGATSYNYTTLTSTYQITPYLSDYRVNDSTTTLNANSDLVQAVGGASGCGGILPPNYDGDYGTYYAGVLYAAESSLMNQQSLYPGSQNVIILLSDGNATAPQSFNSGNGTTVYPMPAPPATSNGLYPSYKNMCAQAVTAAQYATGQGTKVYSIAYGAESSGCTSDASGITPCQTMQNIASSTRYFFSDYTQSGSGVSKSCVGTGATTSNLQQIFTDVYTTLTSPRLIPDGTT